MPFLTVGKTRLYYRFEGSLENPDAPVLVLSSSIGADHGMWAPQMPDLLAHFRVLRYDTRGLGASDAPRAEYTMEQLGTDVLALADALKISQFAFCGLSLGGMIGQWLAIHAPERLTGLVLANTSPRVAPKSNWDDRRRAVLEGGMAAIVDMAMQRFFMPETLAQGDLYASSVRATILATDPVGYAGCCSAIRDMDHTDSLRKIRVPTLVIVSDRDPSTPWEGHGEILAREIPGARVVRLPTAHLSNIERPRSFTSAIFDLLLPHAPGTGPDPRSGDALEAGMEVRREILGGDYVARSLAEATDFNRDFLTIATRYVWGSVWSRPGLDRRTRRLLVLAMTACLGRWEEFRAHLRAGLAHGLEPCDVKEMLLQAGVYGGMPVARTGFQIASEEIK